MPTVVAATLLAILLQSAAGAHRTDRDYADLVGPVHVVRTDHERTVQSGSDKGKLVRERDKAAVYDRNGWLIEELSFGLEGCTLSRHVFQFDGTDKRTETVYWGRGSLTIMRSRLRVLLRLCLSRFLLLTARETDSRSSIMILWEDFRKERGSNTMTKEELRSQHLISFLLAHNARSGSACSGLSKRNRAGELVA